MAPIANAETLFAIMWLIAAFIFVSPFSDAAYYRTAFFINSGQFQA